MVTVTLTKVDTAGNTYTMTFKNFTTWGGNANFPVVAYPLPQEDSDKQILLKIMGNSTDTKYSWIMKDETTTVVTGTGNPDIKTVPEQIDFWLSTMRPKFLGDIYTLTFNFTTPISFDGMVSNFQWNLSSSAPVSADCSFQFMQGEAIVDGSYENDTPSPPLNVVASSPSSGQLKQDWSASTNPGSSAIIEWVFAWRLKNTSTWDYVNVNIATFTYTKTGLSTGTYECVMLARNSSGVGQNSKIQEVSVA